MVLDPLDRAGRDIRERAELQRDLPFREKVDQGRIFLGAGGMADPVDPQYLRRAAHAFGPRRLAGMYAGFEAEAPRFLVNRRERLRRHHVLRAAHADADNAVFGQFLDLGQGPRGVFGAMIAHQIRDQPGLAFRDSVEPAPDRLGQVTGAQSLIGEARRREEKFGIENVLPRQIPRHRLGDESEILRRLEKSVLPDPGVDKGGKVGIGQALAQGRAVRYGGITAMLFDQCPKRVERDRALEMEMQFSLG